MQPAPPTFIHAACLACRLRPCCCGTIPALPLFVSCACCMYRCGRVPVSSCFMWAGWLRGGGQKGCGTARMAPVPPTSTHAAFLACSLLFWWHSLCFGYQFPLIIVTVQLRGGVGNSRLFQGFFPWLSCILCHYQLSQTDPQPCGCALMGGLNCQWSSRTILLLLVYFLCLPVQWCMLYVWLTGVRQLSLFCGSVG
jgi:hypothetical protein